MYKKSLIKKTIKTLRRKALFITMSRFNASNHASCDDDNNITNDVVVDMDIIPVPSLVRQTAIYTYEYNDILKQYEQYQPFEPKFQTSSSKQQQLSKPLYLD